MKQLTERSSKRRSGGQKLLVVLGCTMSVFLVSQLLAEEVESTTDTSVSKSEILLDKHLDKTPSRETTGLEYVRSDWTYDCMECHRSLKANWHLPDQLMEHRGLELKHGTNRFCLNCHHPENRNVYVDYDGSEIAEEEVVLLCAKCHGPQHRDWMKGAHGRRNGYWDTSRGESSKLSCIQCHDPHDPAFKAMEPLTAPSYPSRAAGGRHTTTEHHEEAESHGE